MAVEAVCCELVSEFSVIREKYRVLFVFLGPYGTDPYGFISVINGLEGLNHLSLKNQQRIAGNFVRHH